MAKRERVEYVSDLSGEDITGTKSPTMAFSLDGTGYEIDLTDDEQTRLRTALADYVGAARKRTRSGNPVTHVQVSSDAKTVRAWAQANGYSVPDRGRIPRTVQDAFSAAN